MPSSGPVSSQQAVLLYEDGLADTFPSVNVALRIYLSMMVTRERPCSKLTRIKNHLRTTMEDDRLSASRLLDVESNVLKLVEFEELIRNFAVLS